MRWMIVVIACLSTTLPMAAQPSPLPAKTKTADRLSRDLSAGRAEDRRRAAADLAERGYEAIQAVPALSAALRDDDAAV